MNRKKYVSPTLLAVCIGGEDAVAVDLPIGSKYEDDGEMEVLTKEEMGEEAGGTLPSPTNLWDNAW